MKKTVYTLAIALCVVSLSTLDGWAAGFGEANALGFLSQKQPLLISCTPEKQDQTTPAQEEGVVPEELQNAPADEQGLTVGGEAGEHFANPFVEQYGSDPTTESADPNQAIPIP